MTYSPSEAARVVGVHENTIRQWLTSGLEKVGGSGKTLIFGAAIIAFVRQRRDARRHQCLPGEIFCLRCREPRQPAGDIADLVVVSPSVGRLVGLCPNCGGLIHRLVRWASAKEFQGNLDVRISEPMPRLNEMRNANLNCDSRQDTAND